MAHPINRAGHSSFQTKKLKISEGKFQTNRKVAGRLIKVGVTLLVGKRTASQDKYSGFIETVLRFTVQKIDYDVNKSYIRVPPDQCWLYGHN